MYKILSPDECEAIAANCPELSELLSTQSKRTEKARPDTALATLGLSEQRARELDLSRLEFCLSEHSASHR